MAPERKKSQSKQSRAGLTFPVSRTNTCLKLRSGMKRVGGSAPVYLTAVVEYVTSELLEAAGKRAVAGKRKRLTPEDVTGAMRSDRDLSMLCDGISTSSGEPLKRIAKRLLPA